MTTAVAEQDKSRLQLTVIKKTNFFQGHQTRCCSVLETKWFKELPKTHNETLLVTQPCREETEAFLLCIPLVLFLERVAWGLIRILALRKTKLSLKKLTLWVVFMQSRETQKTMVKWPNAGGQTKRANERSFVYPPPAWRRWRNVKTTYSGNTISGKPVAFLWLFI